MVLLMMMMTKTGQKTLLSGISTLVADTQGVERRGQTLQGEGKRVGLMIVASVLSYLAVVNACIAGHGGVDHVVARVVHGDAQVNTGRARIVRQDIGGGLS